MSAVSERSRELTLSSMLPSRSSKPLSRSTRPWASPSSVWRAAIEPGSVATVCTAFCRRWTVAESPVEASPSRLLTRAASPANTSRRAVVLEPERDWSTR